MRPRDLLPSLVLLATQCSRPDGGAPPAAPAAPPKVTPTILPAPDGSGEAFEPSVAIDAVNPDRILAAAMYGNPGGRGGRNIWTWQSEDGGKTWSSARLRPLMIRGRESGWAADVVAGITPDSTSVLVSMAGADNPRKDGLGGIIVSRRARGDTAFAEPLLVMKDQLGATADRTISYDKPWLAVDRERGSPHRGTVYVISGILDMDLPTEAWARTPVSLSRITMLGLDFAYSRDGGQTFSPVRRVADSVFGSDMTIGPTGILDVVYPKTAGTSSLILDIRSTDGGATFPAPDTVARGAGDVSVGGPMVSSRPNGETMACWSEQSSDGSRLQCAIRPAGGVWPRESRLSVPIPAGTSYAFPTSVGTAGGWYLLMLLLGPDKTDAVVFHSDGTRAFAPLATVASIPGLSADKWCFDRECRFKRDDLFMAGDYVSIAASGGRLVTAVVLPRTPAKLVGQAAVWLSTMVEP